MRAMPAERQAVMADLTAEQLNELDCCLDQLRQILQKAETQTVVDFGAVPLIAGGLCSNPVDMTGKREEVVALIGELEDVKRAGRTVDGPRYVAPLGTVARVCTT